MNIVQKLQKLNDHKKEPAVSAFVKATDAESDFASLLPSLSLSIIQDINKFRAEYPCIKEHVIYKIMKKHDLKFSLVDSELKFITALQPKISHNSQETKEEAFQEISKGKQEPRKAKATRGVGNTNHNEKIRSKPQYARGSELPSEVRSERTKAVNPDRNYSATSNNQVQTNFESKSFNNKYKNNPDSRFAKNQKKYKKIEDVTEEEYVVKQAPTSENGPITQKIDVQVISKQPNELNNAREKESSVKEVHANNNNLDEEVVQSSENDENANDVRFDEELLGRGIQKMVSLTYKNCAGYFKQLLSKDYNMSYNSDKKNQVETKNGSDKKNQVTDQKKRKNPIQKNFEMEESYEDSCELKEKAQTNMQSFRRFQSQDERLNFLHEKSLENTIKELTLKIGVLTAKTQQFEDEIKNLKSINEKLKDINPAAAKNEATELYCIVPFNLVKNAYGIPQPVIDNSSGYNAISVFKVSSLNKL
jgi:hypothetical protein